MNFVISGISHNRKAFEVIQEVDVLKVISLIKAVWEEFSDQTLINCFCKCGFRNEAEDGDVQTLDQNEDDEFANLVKDLTSDVTEMITWILTRILLPQCQQ